MTGNNVTHEQNFERLECWKACRELRLFVVKKVVPVFPAEERYRLTDQLIRSARSTTANDEGLITNNMLMEGRLLVERFVKLLSAYIRYLIKNQSRKVVTTHDSPITY